MDQLDLYSKASEWTLGKVTAAAPLLDLPTPCDDWDVRSLMNHMLATQQYFVASARGEKAAPPVGEPPELLSQDPVADFRSARKDALSIFGADGVIERTGPAIGIAFSDQLLHGWDLAIAIGQSGVMPEELAQAAYDVVHGAFTDDQRRGVFAPEIAVGPDATAQQRLLAYTGRDPS
ncbi:MAG TPA: TIGR03086 family metal-binding protein [Marmoricola sp.]|jgi:uncharacterized protein (TIGR03086 family)|nr:TIGR03086 family metal-binding protein [Marmoricola sp.]